MLAANGYSGVLDRWHCFDGNHSQAVARLTVELARRLGVEGEELEHVHLAALLHDIGKIAVPEHILNKGDRLTEVEQDTGRTPFGDRASSSSTASASPRRQYVLHHHERWDEAGIRTARRGEPSRSARG